MVGQKIDYNGVGALRGQRHIPQQVPKYPCTGGEGYSGV